MVLFCCINWGAINLNFSKAVYICTDFLFLFFIFSKLLNVLTHEFRFAVILTRIEYLLMLKALTHSKEANYFKNPRYRYFSCLVKSKVTELNCKPGNGVMIWWYLWHRQTRQPALRPGEIWNNLGWILIRSVNRQHLIVWGLYSLTIDVTWLHVTTVLYV